MEGQLNLGCCLRIQFRNKNEFAEARCRECDTRLVFKNPDSDSEHSDTHYYISIYFLREVINSKRF